MKSIKMNVNHLILGAVILWNGESPETLQKLCLSPKFRHKEVRFFVPCSALSSPLLYLFIDIVLSGYGEK